MGHWSTYRRRGGSDQPQISLISIINLEVFDTTTMLATYDGTIVAAEFNPNKFRSIPEEFPCTNIDNQGANELKLFFDDDVDLEQGVTYTGTVPGILTPQTILY